MLVVLVGRRPQTQTTNGFCSLNPEPEPWLGFSVAPNGLVNGHCFFCMSAAKSLLKPIFWNTFVYTACTVDDRFGAQNKHCSFLTLSSIYTKTPLKHCEPLGSQDGEKNKNTLTVIFFLFVIIFRKQGVWYNVCAMRT